MAFFILQELLQLPVADVVSRAETLMASVGWANPYVISKVGTAASTQAFFMHCTQLCMLQHVFGACSTSLAPADGISMLPCSS